MERRLRLRDEAALRRIQAGGRRWSGPLLTLLTIPNALPHNRYGAIVSKRVGKAVTRNRVKRRLREVLRRLDRAGRIAPGYDLAVIARPSLAAATFAELQQALTALLARAALLQPATTGGDEREAPPAAREA